MATPPFRRLEIVNFQRHEKINIDLDALVTVLVGDTDKGKSAVVRALLWLCFNQPSGDSFITWGKERCRVRLIVGKHTVTRKRSKDENTYRLDDKLFKAFGAGVPQEIAKLLNVTPDNFQKQIANPFWLCETPGQLSRCLNELLDLSDMDEALANVSSHINHNRGRLELIDLELSGYREEKAKLDWVPAVNERLNKLEEHERNLQKLRTDASEIAGLLLECEKYTSKQSDASNAILAQKNAIAALERLLETRQKSHTLRALLDRHEQTRQSTQRTIPDLTELQQTAKRKQAVAKQHLGLVLLLQQSQRLEEQICRLRQEEEAGHQRLEKMSKGKKCPVCGRVMK